MEIDITEFFMNAAPMDYSASVAEIGQDAGPCTWNAAKEDSAEYMILDTEDKRQAFQEYVKGFGAWSDEEIAAWSEIELNALCMQFLAGDMREANIGGPDTDWDAYDADCREGVAVGRIYKGDDGRVYFYCGM